MVRPIEISDTLSKVGMLERMQQTDKVQIELVRQQQKSLADKLLLQSTTTNPVPQSDHVELHIQERERNEGERERKKEEHHAQQRDASGGKRRRRGRSGRDHIDIKA